MYLTELSIEIVTMVLIKKTLCSAHSLPLA